jgi:hypothetical protein
MGLYKIKKLLHKKRKVSKLKRPSTEWEKIFASYTSDKGLITRIDRELKKLNSPKKSMNQLKSGQLNLIELSQKKKFKWRKKKTHEKMLTISSHKGNANENHTKIPPHPC